MSSKNQYKDALKRANTNIRDAKSKLKELQRKLDIATTELNGYNKALKPIKKWWQFWK